MLYTETVSKLDAIAAEIDDHVVAVQIFAESPIVAGTQRIARLDPGSRDLGRTRRSLLGARCCCDRHHRVMRRAPARGYTAESGEVDDQRERAHVPVMTH